MTLRKVACALAVGGFTVLTAGQAFGHASFVGMTPDGKRDYVEGTSAAFNLNLGHGCGHDPAVPRQPTIAVGMVLPTKASLAGKAYTLESAGPDGKTGTADDVKRGANPLMGVKPLLNASWDSIEPHNDTVPEFYNHGVVTTDVIDIHWNGGNVPDNKVDNVGFRATLPKIEPDSCVGTITVQVASVQYCPDGHLNSWLKEKTGKWNTDELISAGYAASFNIVRDLKNNPVKNAACDKGGKGLENLTLKDLETVTVYPDAADIDAHLAPDFKAVARVPVTAGEYADSISRLEQSFGARISQLEQNAATKVSQLEHSSMDTTKVCTLLGKNKKKPMERCMAKVKKFGLDKNTGGTGGSTDSHGCVAPQTWHEEMGHCM